MIDMAAGVSFPVIFSDGESETNIGNVIVYSTMDFKAFQSALSHKIGISPHQFFVYLAERKDSLSSSEIRRKIPITGSVNFTGVSDEKNCFFLVVLRRSRRGRRQKHRNEVQDYDDDHYPVMELNHQVNKKNPPANMMLLRRNNDRMNGNQSFIEDLQNRVRNLQIEKDRYLINMGLDGMNMEGRDEGFAGEKMRVTKRSCLVCEECLRAEELGIDVDFHCCVNDLLIVGFRTTAGPIARPVKRSD